MTVNRSKPDQYQLRFPPGLRDRLKKAADKRGRSMNAEIINRLENSFKGWPRPVLSDVLFERVRNAPAHKRDELEKEIDAMVTQAVERALPPSTAIYQDLSEVFGRLVERAPEEERGALRAEFHDLWKKMLTATAGR